MTLLRSFARFAVPAFSAQPICRLALAAAILAALAIGSAGPAKAEKATELVDGREAAANQVLVRFRAAAPALAGIALGLDTDEARPVGGMGWVLFHSRSLNVAALLQRLAARPDVLSAEPDYIVHADNTPNDPLFPNLWGLQNTGQVIGGQAGRPGADISAVRAWDITTGSRNNVVGVVDTGIDYTHPDLAPNVWSAPFSFDVTIGGVTRTCPAGSHGYNAITHTFDPMDDNNHGTHCSGTIGAAGNNGVGVAGINWTASILGSKFLNSGGSGTDSGAVDAIEFAIQAKLAGAANVRVLSNSWGGGGFDQSLLDEINRAGANDILFVAAAGNSGSNNDVNAFYPANYGTDNEIAVAATDNQDNLAYFSNYGPNTVHLGAPGVNIESTIRVAAGSYAFFSGTSMATPHVSGAAVLVLSVNPSLHYGDVKNILLTTVDADPSLAGITVTGGRLNVFAAVQAAAPAGDFSVSAAPASQTINAGDSTDYTVTVTPSGGYSGSVAFSVDGLPDGAAATFTPDTITGGGSTDMNVTTDPAITPSGTYTLTITATDGIRTHTAMVQLVVN